MTPRLQIASHIYAGLILRDERASSENPTRNAHRALLFADALLLCDAQTSCPKLKRRPSSRLQKKFSLPAESGSICRVEETSGARPSVH